MIDLVVINKFGLPVIGESIPEQAEHIGDNNCEKRHLENVDDRQDRPIVRNLVISVLVSVAFLHPVQEGLLRDEVARAQPGNPKHLEEQQVAQYLLFFLGIIRKEEYPGDGSERVEQEAAIDNVASGDFFQTSDHIVVFRITERREEVLQDFEEEHDLAVVEDVPELLVVLETEGHYVEVQQHVRYHNDADHYLEDDHKLTLGV